MYDFQRFDGPTLLPQATVEQYLTTCRGQYIRTTVTGLGPVTARLLGYNATTGMVQLDIVTPYGNEFTEVNRVDLVGITCLGHTLPPQYQPRPPQQQIPPTQQPPRPPQQPRPPYQQQPMGPPFQQLYQMLFPYQQQQQPFYQQQPFDYQQPAAYPQVVSPGQVQLPFPMPQQQMDWQTGVGPGVSIFPQ